MVSDSYSNMISDISMRSMVKNSDYGEDLGPYRSGSAPPTVDGSLNAVGGLFDGSGLSGFSKNGGKGFVTEEEIRADPGYVNYYHNNINLNPRLPPPLISREEWRFTQRLQPGGRGGRGPVVGGIGDRRQVGRGSGGDESVNRNASLFSVQPGFGVKEENGVAVEWGGDGLIGLPGLGFGSRQKSIAETMQDGISHATSLSRNPSRSASRNVTADSVETSEVQFSHLNQELASMDALRSGANKHGNGMSVVQNNGGSASHSYASALGASLSRSTTPDPQLIVRSPSPRIPPIGEGRVNSMDKRNVNGPNSFVSSSGLNNSSDLVAALSDLNLSTNMVAEDNHSRSNIQNELDDCHTFFNTASDQNHLKQHSYLNNSDPGQFHLHSASQSSKGSYLNMGRSSGLGMDLTAPSLMADGQMELKMAGVSSANSYLKGSAAPTLNSGGSLPSHYQNMDNPNFSMSNYGLSGYSVNPGSPSMVGSQLGIGNLPPLYDNTAAASAMGVAGMDSRSFGGGSALGHNIMAAAAELQNLNRMGTLMNPMYHQYLRSNEYAAAQLAALNDPTMDREGMASYLNLLGLQNPYLGTILSPQKSQYGVPYLGKSGSLNHGHYGNQAFGLGATYPVSPLAAALLPNSPIGSGSPDRFSERNLHFSSGMRNLAGGVMGAWHSDTGVNLDESFGSSLLDEFKSNKTRCFELSEIAGHVVEFSADQYGSRFIQQKLETASIEEKNMVFHEIMPHGLSLMTDVFGNYVIQKFFEHGTSSQIRELADQLTGHVLTLSLQMYGCRVIQKAIEVVDLDQQTKMVKELDGHIMRCVRDQNGNHVIQKCIECIPEDAIQFIVSTFYDQVVTLSTHPYGCRVIQRVLEHCHNPKTQQIMMDAIFQSVCMLAQDQYGNYVLQHVLEHGKPDERSVIIEKLAGQIVLLSQQKFASNVIEKCLSFGTPTERQVLVTEMLGSTDENEPLQVMMKDQFANYVVQKVLETCDDHQLELILNRIKVHLNALKKYTYGKHIVARVEKLVAAGERRISIQSHSAMMA